MGYFNNTEYITGKGTVMPARIEILNQTPTDTLVKVTPKHGTTHKINLSGKDSTVQRFTGEGGYVPESNFLDDYSDYWINVARLAFANKTSYLDYALKQWNDFKTNVGFKQLGGSLEQQKAQEEFVAFLIADAAQQGISIKNQKDLEQYLAQLGEEGIKQKAQQFAQVKLQQAKKAEKGAKLNYIKSLKGTCPEGEELVYFKKGGMIDCGCQKKEKGSVIEQPKNKLNAVEEFKKGRKKC